MAKKEEKKDLSLEEMLNPLHTRDEKRAIIEYFRNLQKVENQAVEMVAKQQVTCNCGHPTVVVQKEESPVYVSQRIEQPQQISVAPSTEQQPFGAQEQEAQVVFVPSTSWRDLQPFKFLAKLSITDWLLIVIAILLFINTIRRK